MENNYCVYEHVFPNGKKYIGLTKQDPIARWGKNGNGYKGQSVYNAIKKYGWDNIQHNIIANNLNSTEAVELERKLITENDSINNGWNISEGGDLGSECSIQINYDGETYTSEEIANMSQVNGLTGHDVTTRLSRGWDIDRILTQEKTIKNRKYEYQGVLYTAKELADISPVEGMTTEHMVTRLNHHKWDTDRAVNQPLNVKVQPFGMGDKKYYYKGNYYNTYELSQMNPELGLTTAHIQTRLNHHGWSVERAISTPIKNTDIRFEYNGMTYNSHELAELSPDSSIKYHDITDRIRNGWTVWEAVNIPKGTNRKRFYKNNPSQFEAKSSKSN